MSHRKTSWIVLVGAVLGCIAIIAPAAEKKPLAEVKVEELIKEVQRMSGGDSGSNNVVLVFPREFWSISLAKDPKAPIASVKEMLEGLEKYLVVAVVRSDMAPNGGFRFYEEAVVFANLQVCFVDTEGKREVLELKKRADADTQSIIDSLRPMLHQGMGKMGENLHIFVCEAKLADGKVISAYDPGTIRIELGRIGKNLGGFVEIPFPLDSLFTPRKCARCEKEAHISWNFCPWCGARHAK